MLNLETWIQLLNIAQLQFNYSFIQVPLFSLPLSLYTYIYLNRLYKLSLRMRRAGSPTSFYWIWEIKPTNPILFLYALEFVAFGVFGRQVISRWKDECLSLSKYSTLPLNFLPGPFISFCLSVLTGHETHMQKSGSVSSRPQIRSLQSFHCDYTETWINLCSLPPRETGQL